MSTDKTKLFTLVENDKKILSNDVEEEGRVAQNIVGYRQCSIEVLTKDSEQSDSDNRLMLKSPPIIHLQTLGSRSEKADKSESYSDTKTLTSVLGGRYTHKIKMSLLSVKCTSLAIYSKLLTTRGHTTSDDDSEVFT